MDRLKKKRKKINSIQKGKAFERECANLFKKKGFKNCRRGQQRTGLDTDDIVGLPHLSVECKAVERLDIYKAMEQSTRDCLFKIERDKAHRIPIVIHKQNYKPIYVITTYDFYLDYFKKYDRILYYKDNDDIKETSRELLYKNGNPVLFKLPFNEWIDMYVKMLEEKNVSKTDEFWSEIWLVIGLTHYLIRTEF